MSSFTNGPKTTLGDVLVEVDVRARAKWSNLDVLSLTKDRGLVPQSERFKHRVATDDVSKYKVVHPGQLVYNPYVLWEGAIHTLSRQFAGLVSPVYPVWEAHSVDPWYLDYLLRSPQLIAEYERLASGTVKRRRSISRRDFLSIEVNLPSIDEQRRVSGVLRTIQRARSAGESVADKVGQIRRRYLSDAFVGDWPVATIGDFAKVGNGSTPKRDKSQYWLHGDIPWLTSGKIHDGTIEFAEQFVTELAAKECHLPLVPRGSVLVAITGQGKTLGNAALLSIDARVSQHLAYIRFLRDEVLPEYLYYFLSSRYDHLRAIAFGGGSTKGALTCAFLSSYPVPVPPHAEQIKIVNRLAAIDAKLSAESDNGHALKLLFTSALATLLEAAP